MNPFEQFLRRLFGGGLPPTVMEEERQAANLGKTAENMPKMAKELGKAALNSYKQRAQDLQTLANQQVFGQFPLSDFGDVQSPRQAQRDLALDILSAGAGTGMRVGADLLSSAPAVGTTTATRIIPEWLRSSSDYANQKEVIREQLLESFRRSRHPLEGQTPSRRIYHSSRGIFEAPTLDPARQGAGVGDFWQGTGAAYVAESPQVRDYYRNLLYRNNQQDYKLPSGKVIRDPNLKLDEIIKRLENKISDANKKLYADYSDENIKEAAALNKQLSAAINRRVAWSDLMAVDPWISESAADNFAIAKNDYIKNYEALNSTPKEAKELRKIYKDRLKDAETELDEAQKQISAIVKQRSKEPRVTSYSGYFYANPDELFNLNLPITIQPSAERIIAGLNELPVGSGNRGFVLPEERVGDALIRNQIQHMAEPNLSSTNSNAMIVSGQHPGGWSSYRSDFTAATPWQVMEALKDKGIVGNQYLDRNSFEAIFSPQGAVNPTYNYVVTDPSRLRFTDLFSTANPFGPLSFAMQALQNEREKKDAKAPKASKK